MIEFQPMPTPQPARNPIDVDPHLQERFELISKKYSGGLQPHEERRLAEIEHFLDSQDLAKADLVDARGRERMDRIDATLDRAEKAIRDLQVAKLN